MSTSPNGRPEVNFSSLQCKSSSFCILLKPTPHLSFQQEDMVDPYLNQIPKSYFWCDCFEGRTQPLQSDPYFTKHIFTWFKKAIGCIVLKVEVRWQPAGERDVSLDAARWLCTRTGILWCRHKWWVCTCIAGSKLLSFPWLLLRQRSSYGISSFHLPRASRFTWGTSAFMGRTNLAACPTLRRHQSSPFNLKLPI